MIPVTQRGSTCWLACVASITETPLEQMPTYEGDCALPCYGRRGLYELQQWLCDRNVYFENHVIAKLPNQLVAPPGYAILSARITTNNELHAIVVKDGLPVWDPHPKAGALPVDWDCIVHGRSWQIAVPVSWTVFPALDPARAMQREPTSTVPMRQIAQEARRWLEILFKRTRPNAGPADLYSAFCDAITELAAAYADGPTKEARRRQLIELLDDLEEFVEGMAELRRPRTEG